MIKNILVDMDGVLSDFFDSCMKIWEDKTPDTFPQGEWDFPEVLGVSNNQFWKRIDSHWDFWENLKPYSWTKDLISFLDSTKIPWFIATSPSNDENCPTGKIKWLRKHIHPQFNKFMIGKHKELMANKHTILIDDTPKKINAFNAAGGLGILWPAPWNLLSNVEEPFPYVKKIVEEYIDNN